jgi:alpha-beta hydrolase superfamily lysophospholipase
VIERLLADGATVYGLDHLGHGRSDGEPALITDGEHLTADLDLLVKLARADHPDLPLVMIGHSMGGLIATRYAQTHPGELNALVLSGPVIGGNPAMAALLELDPIPEVPIDPAVLSRDPAVGEAYVADPLVYNGPFKPETLRALFTAVAAVAEGPGFGSLPVLWIHGAEDALVPYGPTAEAFEHLRGEASEESAYPGARHEIFNETNAAEVLDGVVAFIDRSL